jgi:tRNA A-37 threonylcarbamoyl transferase component Bud32
MSSRSSRRNLQNEFERYRIRSAHANAAYKIPFGGERLFVKIYGPKRPRITYEIRKMLNSLGVRQPVEYQSPIRRRDFEEGSLRYWEERGYHVPAVVKNPFHQLSHIPVLTTRYIEGMTIRDFLRSEKVGNAEKEEQLAVLFRDTGERHRVALRTDDNRLLHIDANTRNVILAENALYHCDFEMGRPWETPVQCATREVLKLLVSVIEDMGTSFAEPVCRSFRGVYTEETVYAGIEKGITGRPFQRVHRYRNRRKKERDPGQITLYDILHFLS